MITKNLKDIALFLSNEKNLEVREQYLLNLNINSKPRLAYLILEKNLYLEEEKNFFLDIVCSNENDLIRVYTMLRLSRIEREKIFNIILKFPSILFRFILNRDIKLNKIDKKQRDLVIKSFLNSPEICTNIIGSQMIKEKFNQNECERFIFCSLKEHENIKNIYYNLSKNELLMIINKIINDNNLELLKSLNDCENILKMNLKKETKEKIQCMLLMCKLIGE